VEELLVSCRSSATAAGSGSGTCCVRKQNLALSICALPCTCRQPLDTLNVTSINSMLTWLGVTGCSFDSLVHANANGYSNSGATIFDAMTHLIGNCTWPF